MMAVALFAAVQKRVNWFVERMNGNRPNDTSLQLDYH